MDRKLEDALKNSMWIARQFVEWQGSSGGVDMERCKYHQLGIGYGGGELGTADLLYMSEALYRLHGITKDETYKKAADRYCRRFVAGTKEGNPTWQYGCALSCGALYRQYNPSDDSLLLAMDEIYGWSRKRRRTDGPWSYGYFTCGYTFQQDKHGLSSADCGWSNDLSMFGRGLMAYYEVSGNREALDYAVKFTRYFVEEWVPGSLDPEGRWGSGVWSSRLETWLIGPLHYRGFENLIGIYGDEAGWGFSSATCVEYFVRVFRANGDPVLRERAVRSMEWCFDYCQFPDGAVGIHARDDKWLGMTGGAIGQFTELLSNNMLTEEEWRRYLPKVHKAFRWLLKMTKPKNFPPDGVVYVNRQTMPNPGVNVVWLMAWATLGLLDALRLFGGENFTYSK